MANEILKIFIGYDAVESVAWHTLAHSIYAQSSRPVALIPLNIKNLQSIYKRDRDDRQSNSFSYTRFLVPHLTNYSGLALYLDCDMLLRCDISEILEVINHDPGKAVYVVKHDYETKHSHKYLNNKQESYPRKNWSSLILWNCSHPSNKIVNTEFVETASPAQLHRFTWLSDDEIGGIDKEWNWLVGEYESPPDSVKNVHWTIGGPYFDEYINADFSKEWFEAKNAMLSCEQSLK